MPSTATISVATAGRRKGSQATQQPAPSSARPLLALAAGLAATAVAACAGCARSDACTAVAAPFLAGAWRGRGGGSPYAVPATPASRFGSAESAPLPGTPEAAEAAALKAAAAAAAKPPPPTDGPIPGMWVDGGDNAPRPDDAPAWPARVRVERSRMFPRKAGALEAAIKVRGEAAGGERERAGALRRVFFFCRNEVYF